MNKNIDEIAFKFWCDMGEVSELESWAAFELKKDEPHVDAGYLFHLNKHRAKDASLRLAQELMGFEPISEKGELLAIAVLKEQSKLLLDGKITPLSFCKLVQLFDRNFLGLRVLENGSLEYPLWLGDLWNCCDWCDESWAISNSPTLADEAKKVLLIRDS
jgi:hypothetical protein